MEAVLNINAVGREIFKRDPDTIHESIESESCKLSSHARNEAEIASQLIEDKQKAYSQVDAAIAEENRAAKCSETKARIKFRRARITSVLGYAMGGMSAIGLFWAIMPSFWNMLTAAVLLAVGGGLLTLVAGEMLLRALSYRLNKAQMIIFVLAISTLMFGSIVGSSAMFTKSRTLQAQVQEHATDSVLQADDSGIDLESIKKKVESLNRLSLALNRPGNSGGSFV